MNRPTLETAEANLEALGANPYPGDGIVMGLNQAGDTALQVFWRMEKAEGPPDQVVVHVPERELVRVEAWRPPLKPGYQRLYVPADGANMRTVVNCNIAATDGDLMDDIIDGYNHRQKFTQSFKKSVTGDDEPIHTPKIAGVLATYGRPEIGGFAEYEFAIAKVGSAVRSYEAGLLGDTDSGLGRGMHTFIGDGSPPPPFDKYPYPLPLGEGVQDTAEMFWDNLNPVNRVGIVVKGIRLATRSTQYHIINAYEEQLAQGVKQAPPG